MGKYLFTCLTPTLPPSLPTPLPSQNYGDESDAYGLIYPSLSSYRGFYEYDIIAARHPQEVTRSAMQVISWLRKHNSP